MVKRIGVIAAGIVALLAGNPATASTCQSKYSSELHALKAQDDRYYAAVDHRVVTTQAGLQQFARNERVAVIEEQQGLCTFDDYLMAASIRGRGLTLKDQIAAVRLASVAQSMNPSSVQARQIFAHAIDQLTFRAQGKQLYGTLKESETDGKISPVPVIDGAVSAQDRKIAEQQTTGS